MSKRSEEAALKAYPNVEQPVWDESYPKTLFVRHTERNAFIKGYKQAEKDLGWHSVKEYLPPMDEEVIVLTDFTNGKFIKDSHRICFGHIVNPKYCDALENDGWNIPGITHWMYLPELKEEET